MSVGPPWEAKFARRALEREVERGVQRQLGAEPRGVGGVAVEHLAEHEEVGLAERRCAGLDPRAERLPELVVDVLDRVDPEPVDVEVGDHVREDLDQTLLHLWLLGEQVVEAEEVAVQAVLAGERAVAAVVVVGRVVEERRRLDRLVGRGGEGRGVREADRGVERRERARARVDGIVEGDAGGVEVRRIGL